MFCPGKWIFNLLLYYFPFLIVNFNFNHNFNDIHKLMTINVCLQFQIVRDKYWPVSSFGHLYRHFIFSMSKPNLFIYLTLPSVFYHLVKRTPFLQSAQFKKCGHHLSLIFFSHTLYLIFKQFLSTFPTKYIENSYISGYLHYYHPGLIVSPELLPTL